ncbi:MAG: HNH endonuclease [Candidatus Rokubacteria bacterium]|nr:HNH endonuclease [Candidatus Rokubacteria bacterium]MBI2543901.1 HNH endonuclease [Candidatus Rokubacteria bacterium]MBI2554245.1 HNH endonuclease [Candidatus Rokubacteria bacterium]
MRAEPYLSTVTEAELRREREKARALRASQWWKRRIAAGRCHYCDRQVGPRALSMDHVVPLIRGGRSTRGNVVPACKECNNTKKSLLPVEWEEYLRRLAEREDA